MDTAKNLYDRVGGAYGGERIVISAVSSSETQCSWLQRKECR